MSKITIIMSLDNAAFKAEDGSIDYESVSDQLHALADKIHQMPRSMNDINGNRAVEIKYEIDDELDSDEKIACEIANVICDMVAADDISTVQTIQKALQKPTIPNIRKMKNVFAPNHPGKKAMSSDEIANERIAIADELQNDGE